MRVLIDLEIETVDYGGEDFKREVEALIKEIDPNSRLTRFKMRSKFNERIDGVVRDVDWREEDYQTHDPSPASYGEQRADDVHSA